MNPFVVASFSDDAAARAAAECLTRAGFPQCDISLHCDERARDGLDAAIGGLFRSFVKLLHAVFRRRPAGSMVASEAVTKERAMVLVDVRSVGDADRATETLEAQGAVRVARLPQPGLAA